MLPSRSCPAFDPLQIMKKRTYDEGNLATITEAALHSKEWTLTDAIDNKRMKKQSALLCRGFKMIPRPPFDSEGYWLLGYGLNLHLIATEVPKERKQVKLNRIHHFSSCLPRVDHVAFLTDDLNSVEAVLDEAGVYYKRETPPNTGIKQIFLFDPDGNVIEISNCAPEIGKTTCELSPSVHSKVDLTCLNKVVDVEYTSRADSISSEEEVVVKFDYFYEDLSIGSCSASIITDDNINSTDTKVIDNI
eukprot:gene5800-8005_t